MGCYPPSPLAHWMFHWMFFTNTHVSLPDLLLSVWKDPVAPEVMSALPHLLMAAEDHIGPSVYCKNVMSGSPFVLVCHLFIAEKFQMDIVTGASGARLNHVNKSTMATPKLTFSHMTD